MKLKQEYPSVELDGETVVVFAPDDKENFRGMLRLNPTARFILNCLTDETDEAEILQKLKAQYEGDENEMREDISMIIDKLRIAGALEE